MDGWHDQANTIRHNALRSGSERLSVHAVLFGISLTDLSVAVLVVKPLLVKRETQSLMREVCLTRSEREHMGGRMLLNIAERFLPLDGWMEREMRWLLSSQSAFLKDIPVASKLESAVPL